MATAPSPVPNPALNRDPASLETTLRSLFTEAHRKYVETHQVGVAETVARDTYQNWLSENFEVYLGKFDLAYLVNQKGFTGMLARLLKEIAGMNTQARLLLFNALAAYIDTKKFGGPLVSDTLSAFFYSMPQVLPLLFNDPEPKLEQIQSELDKLAKTTGFGENSVKYWKRAGELEPIHKDGAEWHPIPADAKVTEISQGTPYNMCERFPEGPWCPSCFRKELRSGVLKVEVETATKPSGPKKGRGFGHLAAFTNVNKREFVETLLMLCRSEVKTDPGLGLAGDASHVIAAINLALDTPETAVALEKITPDDPKAIKRMHRLSNMSREQVEEEKVARGKQFLLPRSVRLFVERVIAGYSVAHPISHAEVRTRDWSDRLWDWAPASIKPKKKGWGGVQEVATNPLGLCFLVLVAILVMLVVIAGLLVILPLTYLACVILNGMFQIPDLFRPHMVHAMLAIQSGFVAAYLALVLLPIIAQINARFEPYRPRLQTLRIVLAGSAFGITLVGWGTGWFLNSGVAMVVIAAWLVLLAVEFSNKFGIKMTPKFVTAGMERFVTGVTAIGLVILLLGVFIFVAVRPGDAQRATVLASGVTNHVEDRIAKAADVELPPSASKCEKGLASLERSAAKLNMSVDHMCEITNPNDFPCICR